MCDTKAITSEINRAFDAASAAAPPAYVYHYTSSEGLLGIVTTGRMHFTHAHFMNDQSELVYSRDVAGAVIDKAVGGENDRRRNIVLKAVLERISHLRVPENMADVAWYVACFCERGNRLSQWRAYGSQGQGFSIAFATASLRVLEPNLKLRRVLYHRHEQDRMITEIITSCLASFDQSISMAPSREARKEIVGAYVHGIELALIATLPLMKHPAFEEEEEWRLIANDIITRDSEIQFKRGASGIVPFRAIDLRTDFLFNEADGRSPIRMTQAIVADEAPRFLRILPIHEVIHAPCSEPELRKRAVRLLLGRHGYNSTVVSVTGSDIPLRVGGTA